MVNIHKCNICKNEIYYKPEFYRTGNKFVKMNLDKTVHKCQYIELGNFTYANINRKYSQDLEAVNNVNQSEDKFDREIAQANKDFFNKREEYQEGYDLQR
jgi:hypothetical protein